MIPSNECAQETPAHQHASVVQQVEQLNSYIVQLPCWYHSPSAKPNTTPANVPFTEADLASHVLRMYPLTWQDHFNLHKKGMTHVEMHSLLMSLKAIEHVCTEVKYNAQSSKKASNKGNKGNKQPCTEPVARIPKKACTKKHCNLCKKHGDVHTIHNTRDCCKYEKDGKEKANFCNRKKGRKKPNPSKNSFAQMSKELEGSRRRLRNKLPNQRNAIEAIAIPTWYRALGWVAPFKATPTLVASNQDMYVQCHLAMLVTSWWRHQATTRGYMIITVLPLLNTHQEVRPQ